MRIELNAREIPIPARLSGVVDDALCEVKRIHRRKLGKRMGTVCGSLAAVVGAFMIFGFTNPALASEIPLLGSFFKNVSTKTGDFPTNLNGYPTVQTVGKLAQTDNSEWKLMATEAYSDGSAVQIGLELSAPEETLSRFAFLTVDRKDEEYPCGAVVNGEKAEIDTVSIFTREGEKLIGAARIAVPESQRDAEKLDVSFTLRNLQGNTARENAVAVYEDIPGEFKLEFPVAVDRENKVEFTCAAEDTGAQVLAVKSTPAQTVITVEQPYWGDVHENVPGDGSKGYPALYTVDGKEIPMYRGASREEGGWRYDSKEVQKADLYFDGVPAGTKRVLLRFCNDNRYLERKKLAEFTIDLEQKTVTPAGTVVDEDWGTPYDGVAIIGNIDRGEEQNGYAVTCVTFQYDNGVYSALASFDSKRGKVGETERLRLEAADGTGRVIFRSDSAGEQGEWAFAAEQDQSVSFQRWSPQYEYSEEDMDYETARETLAPTGYGVREALTEENGWVLEGDTVTVTISDLDTGEVLCTDTRTLKRME